ncbi:MAG: DUF58 domain-containing protein, partial [Pseudonocardiaceae bacterium]
MLRLRGGLTTRGRCLLAAGLAAALCAVLLEERDLLRVAAFAMVLPLLAALVVRLTQVRLRATREPEPPRIPVGSDCQVRLVVRCTGRCNAKLLLEDGLPSALGSSVTDSCARFAVARLPRD